MLMISIPASKVVLVTQNHGGYKVGVCQACDAQGWVEGHGYPHQAVTALSSTLQHQQTCPMNEVLNEDGSLKAS